ncbi:MAG TPA: chemotaxis protein CheA, partial [Roseiarcus sp.]|nr:chemotaxis protein CheA [Roseiarcus sp.]
MDPMAAIRDTFFQECGEQLTEVEAGLEAMDSGQADAETVNAVFRAVHSIKGGAGAFQLDRLVHFAHAFESTLDGLRSGKITPSDSLIKTMFRSKDALSDLVEDARAGKNDVDENRIETLIGELKSNGSRPENETATTSAAEEEIDFQPVTLSIDDLDAGEEAAPDDDVRYTIAFAPRRELYRRGNEPARLLRELARLGEINAVCDFRTVPSLEGLDPEESYLAWRIDLKTGEGIEAVQDVFDFVIGDCDLEIAVQDRPPDIVGAASAATEDEKAPDAPLALTKDERTEAPPAAVSGPSRQSADKPAGDAPKPEAAPTATIRVDLDRVDRLINLVGELVINQAMLSQKVMEAGMARSSGIASVLGALEQLTREIQEGVMATRAQPVKPLFQRMARIVRELAEETGKSVRLRTEGEATEVDRTVIERLADPLTHMIRNAVDHGLETRDARLAAGKSEQGEIRLSAAHRSGRIVIDVADDGAGINREKVKSIAAAKELIAADAQLSDADIDNLLFLPGFSTATTVSNISGRGVGMDVVKRSVQALGGRISIASRPGVGSTFSMSLPLTLAVLDGMVVSVADQTFVVPLTAIAETLRPQRKDVHGLGVETRVIADRGGFAPLIDIGQVLGVRDEPANPLEGVVLIVETEVSARCALLVDAIHDQRQVVIKSLEANYRQVPGIAAATILGDGR